MAVVGSFGSVVFEAGADTVRTFGEFQRDVSARWAQHDIIGAKPVMEFIGPSSDGVTLPVKLNVMLLGGATVESEIRTLEEAVHNGYVGVLTVGNDVFGRFCLESFSETRKHFGKNGETLYAELSLSLKEYKGR